MAVKLQFEMGIERKSDVFCITQGSVQIMASFVVLTCIPTTPIVAALSIAYDEYPKNGL
jgi:hypothetical protein